MARNNRLKNAYFKLLHKKIRKQKSCCSRLTYRSMQRSQKRQQASAFITNISNYALTDGQIIALSKGLGFIPTPDKPSKISLIREQPQKNNEDKTSCCRKAKVHSNTTGLQDQVQPPFRRGSKLDRFSLNT